MEVSQAKNYINNSNEKNKLNNTKPRNSNSYKNTENEIVNIKLNYLEKNNSTIENHNDLGESKDMNGDSNNFIVTFISKYITEIENIII